MSKLAVIIVASGNSRRIGLDKLMQKLAGKPVLQHALDAFQYRADVLQTIVVTPLERWELLDTEMNVQRVDGGEERQHSVMAGLELIHTEASHIAVHDGARPLISQEQINKVIEAAQAHQAATSAKQITDTVKRSTDLDFTESDVNRDNLWAMETPQIFERKLLEQAYAHVLSNSLQVTDEVSALKTIGHSTKLIHNQSFNTKVTLPGDLRVMEALMGLRN